MWYQGADKGKIANNKSVCVIVRNYVPLEVGVMAQIKVLTTLHDIQWSKEEYSVVHSPTMAGGRQALKKRDK